MKKIILLSLILFVFLTGCDFKNKNANKEKIISLEEAKTITKTFVEDNLVRSGTKVVITGATEEDGLYKVSIELNNTKIDAYLSKNGKRFFPQAYDIAEINEKRKASQKQVPTQQKVSKKQEKPDVKLFVMSHCPYGTQMEKGILPVLDVLGDKINFELEFCSYTMHGNKETEEQLRQHCIKQKEPQKLLSYLKCFLADGKSDECLKENKIDKNKINSCVEATDKKYSIRKNAPNFEIYKEDNDKYGVKGSPSLVINGSKISVARDSNSLLNIICSAFDKAPKECNTKLSSDSPAPGFGFNKKGSNTSATCN